jgi:DNA-binding beta-propeller fold protein YncE
MSASKWCSCAQKDNVIFAAARGAGKILVINPVSIEIVQEIKVGSKPNGPAWDSRRKRLLVADVEDFQARLIDISSGQIISTIKLPGRPRWCVYDYNIDCFLVNIRNPACVSILAAAESALQTAVLPISFEGPHGLDIEKGSDRAFIACDGRAIVALDMKNKGHEIGSVSIAGEPDVILNNQNKGLLYCAIGKPSVIDVICTDTMTLVEEIHTEEDAHTFVFDNTRQLLYSFLPDSCRAAVYNET